MENVQNKMIMITGGASGIGYCIVEELLRNNSKLVIIIDLPKSKNHEAVFTLQQKFGKERAILFACDITDIESLREIFEKVSSEFGEIDILINNAGICNDEMIEETFNVNVIALIRSSLLGLDYMGIHKNRKGGTIVNIASVAGLDPILITPVYTASKSAVVGFSRALEGLYDKTNVRILVMCPHYTATNLVKNVVILDIVKHLIEADMKRFKIQSAGHVASATLDLIQKGDNGAIWVVQYGEPPFAVNLPKL